MTKEEFIEANLERIMSYAEEFFADDIEQAAEYMFDMI